MSFLPYSSIRFYFQSLLVWLPLVLGMGGVAQAQSITPAADGTQTTVQQVGDRYNINGGTTTGSNLFHSFDQFGLGAGETANFWANPDIANILGRITGGDASYINGLIQVSNSSANLFLMNPAGLVFGPQAQLNVGGDFTATTATGIGFGEGWFNAVGTPDYETLVGSPTGFIFSEVAIAAAVVNQGNLAVNPTQRLLLLGGTAVNTGNLQAPGGQVVLLAVPEAKMVRLSQTGMVLDLEFMALDPAAVGDLSLLQATFNPLSLPDLLTGGNFTNATDLTIAADGTVSLTGSGFVIPPEPGVAIAAGAIAVNQSQAPGGTVAILGQRVAVVDATIDAAGTTGGLVRIGGDYQGKGTVPNAALTLVNGQSLILANGLTTGDGGRVIVWADGSTSFRGQITAQGGTAGGNGGFVEVSGKQHLDFRGQVNTSAALGRWGTLLLDPTTVTIENGVGDSTTDGVNFVDLGTGPSVIYESELQGLAASTNVSITADDRITINDLTDNLLEFARGAGAGTINFTVGSGGSGLGYFVMDATDTIRAPGRDVTVSGVQLTVGSIDTSTTDPSLDGGRISLNAEASSFGDNSTITVTGNLTTTSPFGNSGNISLDTSSSSDRAAIRINGDLITTSQSGSSGGIGLGSYSYNGDSTITIDGNLDTTSPLGSSGYIDVYTNSFNFLSDITITGNLDTHAPQGTGGQIDLKAYGKYGRSNLAIAGNILTASDTSGNITLTSQSQTDDSTLTITGDLDTTAQTSDGGAVTVTAEGYGSSYLTINGSIKTDATVGSSNAGEVNLASQMTNGSTADLTITGNITATSQGGDGGTVTLLATGSSEVASSTITVGGNITTTTSGIAASGGDIKLTTYARDNAYADSRITVGGNLEASGSDSGGGSSAGDITINATSDGYGSMSNAVTISGNVITTGDSGGRVEINAGGRCGLSCTSETHSLSLGNVTAEALKVLTD
ncbi:two-partner secretion domain-containing protein [Prochlorothrix hollandica]|uniref:two-partner secretion domain-containing protein n=1 Tax=Prochlorothrix hollandica TaxID=1223 RepID=UPI000344E82D|nr:filamentous hemagglutinin N-terminal domain-containing protein [Prochlorothrix hollandica]